LFAAPCFLERHGAFYWRVKLPSCGPASFYDEKFGCFIWLIIQLDLMNGHLREAGISALALILALWLSGGQFMVLQLTAWSGMIVVRTMESGMKEALSTTFDGEHPCHLCKAIKKAQHEEQSPQTPSPSKVPGMLKIEASLVQDMGFKAWTSLLAELAWRNIIPLKTLCEFEPPVPPPRIAA
jgi:hypothetical protein